MTLSPEDHAEVIDRITAAVLADLRAGSGTGALDEFIVIPIGFVAQCLGVTRQHAARILPITRIGGRTIGVTRKALRDYVARNTEQPRTKRDYDHDQDGTPPRHPRL